MNINPKWLRAYDKYPNKLDLILSLIILIGFILYDQTLIILKRILLLKFLQNLIGSLLGFTLAAVSILIFVITSENEIFIPIKKSKRFPDLYRSYFYTIFLFMIFLLFSLSIYFTKKFPDWLIYFIYWLSFISLLKFTRSTIYLWGFIVGLAMNNPVLSEKPVVIVPLKVYENMKKELKKARKENYKVQIRLNQAVFTMMCNSCGHSIKSHYTGEIREMNDYYSVQKCRECNMKWEDRRYCKS